ncbi:cytochrome c1 [Hyalella azteca]|uniref:Cytochrome c1 n=1 Tax=Hyalella azteca TaxID=294128 RepID=A0A8B7NEC1_HYAAZ|nr:cytochrome c1 [Hyalella azteca]
MARQALSIVAFALLVALAVALPHKLGTQHDHPEESNASGTSSSSDAKFHHEPGHIGTGEEPETPTDGQQEKATEGSKHEKEAEDLVASKPKTAPQVAADQGSVAKKNSEATKKLAAEQRAGVAAEQEGTEHEAAEQEAAEQEAVEQEVAEPEAAEQAGAEQEAAEPEAAEQAGAEQEAAEQEANQHGAESQNSFAFLPSNVGVAHLDALAAQHSTLLTLTEADIDDFLRNQESVNTLTSCFQNPVQCQSAPALALLNGIHQAETQGACGSCTPEQSAHMDGLLYRLVEGLSTRYPQQWQIILPRVLHIVSRLQRF